MSWHATAAVYELICHCFWWVLFDWVQIQSRFSNIFLASLKNLVHFMFISNHLVIKIYQLIFVKLLAFLTDKIYFFNQSFNLFNMLWKSHMVQNNFFCVDQTCLLYIIKKSSNMVTFFKSFFLVLIVWPIDHFGEIRKITNIIPLRILFIQNCLDNKIKKDNEIDFVSCCQTMNFSFWYSVRHNALVKGLRKKNDKMNMVLK